MLPRVWGESSPWADVSSLMDEFGVSAESDWDALCAAMAPYRIWDLSADDFPRYELSGSAWEGLSSQVSGQYVLRDEDYEAYLSGEYKAVLESILKAKYSVSMRFAGGPAPLYIYEKVSEAWRKRLGVPTYPYRDNPILAFMVRAGIPPDFDY